MYPSYSARSESVNSPSVLFEANSSILARSASSPRYAARAGLLGAEKIGNRVRAAIESSQIHSSRHDTLLILFSLLSFYSVFVMAGIVKIRWLTP